MPSEHEDDLDADDGKKAKSRKRKRESDVASSVQKSRKPGLKKEKEGGTSKKKVMAGTKRKNGNKSKEMVESEDEGAGEAEAEAEAEAEDEDAGPSKKPSPPPVKKVKRDKEDEADDGRSLLYLVLPWSGSAPNQIISLSRLVCLNITFTPFPLVQLLQMTQRRPKSATGDTNSKRHSSAKLYQPTRSVLRSFFLCFI